MQSLIAAVEHWLATVLQSTASSLIQLAARLESAPLSSVCSATLTRLSFYSSFNSFNSVQIILSSVVLGLLFVVLVPLIFTNHFRHTPYLATVPPPSAIYDPDLDYQSDSFSDYDVRPQLVPPSTPRALAAINPGTGTALGYLPTNTVEDLPSIISHARTAHIAWAKSSFARRRRVLRVLRNYLLYEQRTLCQLSVRDTGKTMLDAALGEILPTLEKIRWLLTDGEMALCPDVRRVGPLTIHKRAEVHFQPLGVLAAIAPWNYPLHNMFNPVTAALFSGCAIVVKPSEHAAWSSVHFARVIRRALTLCGEDADLVQIVVGGPDVGEALVGSPDVDKVFFTGSTSVGRMVAQSTAKRLIPTCLELGGKDPCIICEDADIPHVVSICLRGVFQNSGQNCIGIERVYVHEKIAQRFTKLVVEKVKAMRLGIDIGALTLGETAINTIQSLVDDAVAQGATVLSGGKRASVEGKGFYYEPTVLSDVTMDMRIAKEEVFGPVMSVFQWSDETALIKSVNSCEFKLGSNVFSGDKHRAERILSQLRVGMGNVNDFATNYLCQSMPFGGTGQSGSDRFAGIEGLRGCCVPKAMTRDRLPGVRTSIPTVMQYPVSRNAFEFAAEINDLTYASGIIAKFDNIRNIVGMMLFKSWRPRTTGSG